MCLLIQIKHKNTEFSIYKYIKRSPSSLGIVFMHSKKFDVKVFFIDKGFHSFSFCAWMRIKKNREKKQRQKIASLSSLFFFFWFGTMKGKSNLSGRNQRNNNNHFVYTYIFSSTVFRNKTGIIYLTFFLATYTINTNRFIRRVSQCVCKLRNEFNKWVFFLRHNENENTPIASEREKNG